MLKRIGAHGIITSDPAEVRRAEKIILPGVGSFDYGMTKLKELNLLEELHQKVVQEKTPILGICIGAQLFCQTSEEGNLPGLGWIDARVQKFPTQLNGHRYA